MIVDGADQAKYMLPWPPFNCVQSVSKMLRPKLHLSAAIVHGWSVALFLSEADSPKDSNSCMKRLAFVLDRLKQKGCAHTSCFDDPS